MDSSVLNRTALARPFLQHADVRRGQQRQAQRVAPLDRRGRSPPAEPGQLGSGHPCGVISRAGRWRKLGGMNGWLLWGLILPVLLVVAGIVQIQRNKRR